MRSAAVALIYSIIFLRSVMPWRELSLMIVVLLTLDILWQSNIKNQSIYYGCVPLRLIRVAYGLTTVVQYSIFLSLIGSLSLLSLLSRLLTHSSLSSVCLILPMFSNFLLFLFEWRGAHFIYILIWTSRFNRPSGSTFFFKQQ